MQLDLDSAKEHLNIDSSDRASDAYVKGLVAAAKAHIKTYLGRPVYWCAADYPATPGDLDFLAEEDTVLAGLLCVSHWFTNREAVLTGTIAKELPLGVAALLNPHRIL